MNDASNIRDVNIWVVDAGNDYLHVVTDFNGLSLDNEVAFPL